jgi:hypothetical protein
VLIERGVGPSHVVAAVGVTHGPPRARGLEAGSDLRLLYRHHPMQVTGDERGPGGGTGQAEHDLRREGIRHH